MRRGGDGSIEIGSGRGRVGKPHKYVVRPVNKGTRSRYKPYARSRAVYTLGVLQKRSIAAVVIVVVVAARPGFKAGKFIVPRGGGQKRRKG